MEQCCGVTKRGARCKRITYMKKENYGVELYACTFHNEQNIIREWSLLDVELGELPKYVRNYLAIFHSVAKKMKFMNNVPVVMLSTYIYNKDTKADTTDCYSLRDEFYDHIFKESKLGEDCSVCMESKTDIITQCNHSYCKSCIYQWSDIKGTCPMCREQFLKIF